MSEWMWTNGWMRRTHKQTVQTKKDRIVDGHSNKNNDYEWYRMEMDKKLRTNPNSSKGDSPNRKTRLLFRSTAILSNFNVRWINSMRFRLTPKSVKSFPRLQLLRFLKKVSQRLRKLMRRKSRKHECMEIEPVLNDTVIWRKIKF